jgi:S1-C subfamily serine protease
MILQAKPKAAYFLQLPAIIAVIILNLSMCNEAKSQSWQPVGHDTNNNQFDFDTSYKIYSDSVILAWERVTYYKDKLYPGTFRYAHSIVGQIAINCGQGTIADVSSQWVNASGNIVGSVNNSADKWNFIAYPPDSMSGLIQKKLCDLWSVQSSLMPKINVTPTSKVRWKSIRYDPTSKIQWVLDEDSVTTADNVTTFISMSIADDAQNVLVGDTNILFKYYISRQAVDCSRKIDGVQAVDDYDANGKLVYSWERPLTADKFDEVMASEAMTDGRYDIICNKISVTTGPGQPTVTANSTFSTGTAWLGPRGYLVTANHVVSGATRIGLIQNGKAVGGAELVIADPANDIAILKPHLTDGLHAAIQIRSTPVRLGERTFTLGYPAPDALGLSIKMTSGEVSAITGNDGTGTRTDDPRILQISVPVQSGNSGGPLLDSSGRAVGIIVAKQLRVSETEIAQNINYAVKIGYLQNLLSELQDIGGYKLEARAGNVVDIVSNAKGSVFLIIAESDRKKDH